MKTNISRRAFNQKTGLALGTLFGAGLFLQEKGFAGGWVSSGNANAACTQAMASFCGAIYPGNPVAAQNCTSNGLLLKQSAIAMTNPDCQSDISSWVRRLGGTSAQRTALQNNCCLPNQ